MGRIEIHAHPETKAVTEDSIATEAMTTNDFFNVRAFEPPMTLFPVVLQSPAEKIDNPASASRLDLKSSQVKFKNQNSSVEPG